MSAELHLPDLPEIPVSIGMPPEPEPEPRRRREALSQRIRGLFSTYLPLMLMAILAVATWWLAQHSPKAPDERAPQVARHVPDYTAERATLQRYDSEGRQVGQVEGEQVRHYPDTDEIEVDTVHLTSTGPDGRRTQATARQALASGDGARYSLQGGARIVSTGPDGHTVEIEGEHLLILAKERRVRADKPVVVRQGGSTVVADTLDFDENTQQMVLNGHVRATLWPADMKAVSK